jgi:hypothetical protein
LTGIPEHAHIRANLGQHSPSLDAIDPRNRVQPLQQLFLAGNSLLDLCRKLCNLQLDRFSCCSIRPNRDRQWEVNVPCNDISS